MIENKDSDKSYDKQFAKTVIFVLIMFLLFAGILIFLTWPISEFSISKAGTFGDSFGVLTSLFTGLAFAGLLATIALQREDLKLSFAQIKETQKEIQIQSETFQRQRFEASFYQMLALYKENLRELSIRPHGSTEPRILGIEALLFLITKFEKAWAKHNFDKKFPSVENERSAYLYVLVATIKAVFVPQTRYVETVSSILVLIEDECPSSDKKEKYWMILASQFTIYEVKYLFYQALVAPEFKLLRNVMLQSQVFQDRVATASIPDSHRECFELIWDIELPKKRSGFASPLSRTQIKEARKLLQLRGGLAKINSTKDTVLIVAGQ